MLFRSDVGSERLQDMSCNLLYIVEVLVQYMNNEDVATAALGLLEAICAMGIYVHTLYFL